MSVTVACAARAVEESEWANHRQQRSGYTWLATCPCGWRSNWSSLSRGEANRQALTHNRRYARKVGFT